MAKISKLNYCSTELPQHRVLCLYYYSDCLGFLHDTQEEEVYKTDQITEWDIVEHENVIAKVNISTKNGLNEDLSIYKFFKIHKCYHIIPKSSKLVVFDTQLLVKKAFFALVYNGLRAAPLWDSKKQKFVGMLTITDFIQILQMYYVSSNFQMDELETHHLETWRSVLCNTKDLVFICPDASLFEAIKMLIKNKVHRLPVIDPDTNNVLCILTHKRLLRFLFIYIYTLPKPQFLAKSVFELNVGTYENIETARPSTRIIEALHKFVNKKISALPIVNNDGKLVDIYAKFDNLAAEKTYENLDISLEEANEYRNGWFEGVHKCKQTDSLFDVMKNIVKAEVHRLVVVDDDDKVIGIISLSDLLAFLVMKPSIFNEKSISIQETKNDSKFNSESMHS
ncbi:5'-AMP-activated protein kinase subunit gamma-1 isoform X2 [Lepeophtheirus salmonis]|uniref:5'-AMP-activated protein kinase subunit gamma-1 isoform X2 n=1 Tax=Lepeophtheirus salmonis TaxID=72036 RepID=UPI003AF338D7